MPKLRVYRIPISGGGGGSHQKPYAGDDSEVFETSPVYKSKKNLRFIKDSSIYNPGSLLLGLEVRASAGSYDLGVFLDGGSLVRIIGTDTSYVLQSSGVLSLGAVPTGIHTLDFRLRNTSPGSSFLRLTDMYLFD